MSATVLPPRPLITGLPVIVVLALFPGAALANNITGPQTGIGFVALLIAIPLLTTLGGGAAILERLKPKSRVVGAVLSLLKILVVLFGFLLVGTVGTAGLPLLVLPVYALFRAARLVIWGVKAAAPESERPAHLAGTSRRRLIAAGCGLVFVTVVLTHLSLSFVLYDPLESQVSRQLMQLGKAIKDDGESNKGADGLPRYRLPKVSDYGGYEVPHTYLHALRAVQKPSHGRWYVSDVTLGPDGKSLQAWAWPRRVPNWPWNHLMPLASFYLDQTGQLRMVRVSEVDQRCPPTAPVYAQIDDR